MNVLAAERVAAGHLSEEPGKLRPVISDPARFFDVHVRPGKEALT